MKKIVLTGGGTAGHVTPHLALLPHLKERGWEIHYIGTRDGIERELIGHLLPYYSISAGKLRRYFDLKNFSDPFRVLKGVFQAVRILRTLRPQLVFSKGGFVTVPVTLAAWLVSIPVILHESDLTPGLANRISLPFARKLCLTFPDSLEYVGEKKAVVTGTPIRGEIKAGSRNEGLRLCRFSETEPTVLVMGGSLGSAFLNEVVRNNLAALTRQYQVIHLCGRGNYDQTISNRKYFQIEYADEELPHLFAAADFVVSRAGANVTSELIALRKLNVLVPLSKEASRGDQIQNAQSFAKQGLSVVIAEEDLDIESLVEQLSLLKREERRFLGNMEASLLGDGTFNVLRVIDELSP
ncbi:MAG: undecaprenyldiphospho-muramoylpentapeptide beta-N-acetylglucosaminyltransferase [Firmicutes bacterium]|nr:undecaprenyldiphospho-muramoylpentapeptide beta-N-acetylglucosaminyltransferase [Bacillota bacterium]